MENGFAPLRSVPPNGDFRPVFAAPQKPKAPVAEPAPEVNHEALARVAIAEEARAAGYAAGLEAGRRATEALGHERIAMAVESLAAALDQAREAAEEAAQAAASDLASLTLAMLETALPGMAARHAPDTLQALVASLLPRLRLLRSPRMSVAPGLAESIAPVLQGLAVTIAENAALPEGDARVEWEAGMLRFDRADRMAALREALAQAGIALEG